MNSKEEEEEAGEEVEKRRGVKEAGILEDSSGFLQDTRELENLEEFRSTLEITEAMFRQSVFVLVFFFFFFRFFFFGSRFN